MEKKQIVVGYKGFNKGLKCKDFQYEVGKEYEQYGELKVCENGFHFCEYPLDILNYYPLQIGNEFAQIEARGEIKTEGDKSATNKIYIKTKLDLPLLIKASIDFIWERASKGGVFKKGNATSGNRANSATSGYGAHSATSSDDTIACSVGRKASAKGVKGCWIVLAEWKEGVNFTDAKPIGVKAIRVDGKKIKENTYYRLVGGKFEEAKDITD